MRYVPFIISLSPPCPHFLSVSSAVYGQFVLGFFCLNFDFLKEIGWQRFFILRRLSSSRKPGTNQCTADPDPQLFDIPDPKEIDPNCIQVRA